MSALGDFGGSVSMDVAHIDEDAIVNAFRTPNVLMLDLTTTGWIGEKLGGFERIILRCDGREHEFTPGEVLAAIMEQRGKLATQYEPPVAVHWDDDVLTLTIPRDPSCIRVQRSAEQPCKVYADESKVIAATLGPRITGETSDGYHTFNELYHHRAVLFSVIVRDHNELAWKSKMHHDGTMYDGMFIVGIETPQGQATYHYDIDPYWEMFNCKELEQAPEWDGHTPADATARIATLERGTCHITVKDNMAETEGMGDVWLECDACHWQMPLEPSTPRFNFCPNCGKRVEVDDG